MCSGLFLLLSWQATARLRRGAVHKLPYTVSSCVVSEALELALYLAALLWDSLVRQPDLYSQWGPGVGELKGWSVCDKRGVVLTNMFQEEIHC